MLVVIRVMAPDLAAPSGGIKVIYRFVENLRALGYDARVWHGTLGFAFESWRSDAPVDTGLRLRFDPGDVLVMTEVGRWNFLSEGHPIVILCQGVDFVFAASDFRTDEPGAYPAWPDATAAIATSESIHDFLEAACTDDFPVHHVPLDIEDYFTPREKQRQIALMPRRRREDLLATVHLLRRSGLLAGWEVVLIDGMTQAQVAEALGEAAIFLFGGEREGFGLPGAEAMAAGCYVVGFTGDGAKEYMLPGHSSPVPESDCVGAAARTAEAMRWFDEERATYDARTRAGREFVAHNYNTNRSRTGLEAAFAAILAPGSRSLIAETVELSHYQAHAPVADVVSRVRVGARSAARRAVSRVASRQAGRSLRES